MASFLIAFIFFVCAALGVSGTNRFVSCGDLSNSIDNLTTQVLLVNGKPGSVSKATVQSCENLNGTWTNALPTYDAVIGSNGITQSGGKEEGDNMTPSGTFGLGEFFGWTPTSDPVVQKFTWDYRYIVDAKDQSGAYLDKFVDDSASPYYNTWVVGPSSASSYEQMRISPYKYGLVINYNMFPTIPGKPLSSIAPNDFVQYLTYPHIVPYFIVGKGSAIFMHIWSGPDGSTAGCVALDEANLIAILQWLDKTMQPQMVIVPPIL